jgi:hypothetical protein
MSTPHATRWLLALALAAATGCYTGAREHEAEDDGASSEGGSETGDDPPRCGGSPTCSTAT